MVEVADNQDDPCTSRSGRRKQRWPNCEAAWFVAYLASTGHHKWVKRGRKMYAYHCENCEGWHVSTCRSPEDKWRHRRGIEELVRRLGKKKNPHVAKKNT